MGPPGAPFRLGPGAKCPSCPPLRVAGSSYIINLQLLFITTPFMMHVMILSIFK